MANKEEVVEGGRGVGAGGSGGSAASGGPGTFGPGSFGPGAFGPGKGFPTDAAEAEILLSIQGALNHVPGVLPVARGMSFVGEHAAGWLLISAAGAALDKPRRRQWLGLGAAAFCTHAASVVIKRIVRRPRPHDPRIAIGVGTPSKLSFPSSHATSTTAAMVALSRTIAHPAPLAVIPLMMISRMVLGVHYPTDVTVGALLGAAGAQVVDTLERRLD